MGEYVPRTERIMELITELEREGFDMTKAREYLQAGDNLRAYRIVKWLLWRRNKQLRESGQVPTSTKLPSRKLSTKRKVVSPTEDIALVDNVSIPFIRGAWLEVVARLEAAGFQREHAEKMADQIERRYEFVEQKRITVHVMVDANASIEDILARIKQLIMRAIGENK